MKGSIGDSSMHEHGACQPKRTKYHSCAMTNARPQSQILNHETRMRHREASFETETPAMLSAKIPQNVFFSVVGWDTVARCGATVA